MKEEKSTCIFNITAPRFKREYMNYLKPDDVLIMNLPDAKAVGSAKSSAYTCAAINRWRIAVSQDLENGILTITRTE